MEKRIDANVMLKGMILFTLGFVLAGLAGEYAIALGVIGGFVSGFISKSWKTKELPKSDGQSEGDLIRSVKKIRERFVRKPSDSAEPEDESTEEPDEHDRLSALKRTKPKPEMGWFGIKYSRKPRR